jgi:hypothetical protein
MNFQQSPQCAPTAEPRTLAGKYSTTALSSFLLSSAMRRFLPFAAALSSFKAAFFGG